MQYGAGKHIDFSPSAIQSGITASKLGFISRLLYQLTLCLTKLGICTFYLRIFQDRVSKRLNYAMMCAMVAYTIPLELVIIFQCNPVKGAWDFTIRSKCIDVLPGLYANGILNILSDALLIAFVVPRIRR
jgi:hypothetical protein